MNLLTSIFCFLFLLLTGSYVSTVFGQKPKECDVNTLQKPKFKIVRLYTGKSLTLKITINPKYQTDENLIRLAKYIRQKYCEEKIIIVQIFDNKKDAREFTIYQVKQIPDTERALYYLDRDEGKEKLVRVKVIDNKQMETLIKLPD